MLASLGKDNTEADIKGVFELKLAGRRRKDKFAIQDVLSLANKENKKEKEKDEADVIDMDDLSSISSVKSDNELWDCIDLKGSKGLGRLDRSSLVSEHFRKNTGWRDNDFLYQSSENQLEKDADMKARIEKYESTIQRLKENHKLDIESLADAMRSKAKDMLTNKAEEIKRQFEREIRNLMIQLAETKRLLSLKEAEIAKLKEVAQQQEAALSLARGNSLFRANLQVAKSADTVDALAFSKEELSAMKKEFESMKAVLLTFKKDDENKAREIIKLKQEMTLLVKQHNEEIQKIKNEYESQLNDSQTKLKVSELKCQQIQKEFTKFKGTTELEIKVLKALNERYKQKTEKIVPPLKNQDPFNKTRNSAFTDILNTSMTSDIGQGRHPSQPYHPFDIKPRLRAMSKGKGGIDTTEVPSLSGLDNLSLANTTIHPKSKDEFTKNEVTRNASMEVEHL